MHSSATSTAIRDGVQLRHRDLAHRVLAVLVAPGRHVDHLPRRLDLRRHLGELVADHLELADLAAERGALLRVLERAVEAALGAGDAAGGADQPLALELPHDVVEALADLAEHRRLRHAHVLEGEQRGVGGVHAELLELLLADHAGRVHRHEEQREAVVAGVRVGLRDEHDHVGAVAVRDVGLRAVDDVLVAVPHRARLDAGDVGAGVGLGDAEAEDLLALDRGHDPLLLLLLGAELEDRRHRHVGVDRDAHREAAGQRAAHLLGEHEVGEVVAALAAVLLGYGEAEEAELAHARGRPSRGRSSPPTPRRAAPAPWRRSGRSTRAAVVLLGEDEVLALGRVVGLQDVLGGRGVNRRRGRAGHESG